MNFSRNSVGIFRGNSVGIFRGNSVGIFRGNSVGIFRGNSVGIFRGNSVGIFRGNSVGIFRGNSVGIFRGNSVGIFRGNSVGIFRGNSVGIFRGNSVGIFRGNSVGIFRGNSVGIFRGNSVGIFRGNSVGIFRGNSVGIFRGNSVGIFRGNSVGIFRGNSVGIFRGNSVGIFRGNSVGIFRGNSEEAKFCVSSELPRKFLVGLEICLVHVLASPSIDGKGAPSINSPSSPRQLPLARQADHSLVIHLQPNTLFINRVGVSICLQQCDCQTEEWINPSDPPKLFRWQSSTRTELLKLRVQGYGWSTSFSVCSEGAVRVPIGREDGTDQLLLRVQVRSGTKNSRYEVIFRPNSVSGPYRLSDSGSTAVSVDPFIQIGVNISEVRFKVSMAMSPSQRPRGVLGFWSSLMTALGNTENMPVRISERFSENISMRQSTMINNAIRNVKKDLLGQPLQLLSGVDILGNASSALGHMSQGIAALSMDKKFIQSRQRQESKGVEDFGDIIREGGGALAKGLFRGVTGILTKPLEGAKSSGVEGFVSGANAMRMKIAAAITSDEQLLRGRLPRAVGADSLLRPYNEYRAQGQFDKELLVLLSGVLDLLSKTTEGANAMRMKIAAAITSDEQLLRRRLPRAVGADSLLRPYNEYRAQGQVILQLAESGSFLGQVDLFKVRGKFALTDAYESHFILPKGKVLMITHRRVILLQQPSNIMGQRKFIPAKDACSIQWDVLWTDLVTMELTDGKRDQPNSPPSRLILYLRSKSHDSKDLRSKLHDSKEQFHIVKCSPNTKQAFEVYSAIDQTINLYGQNASKGLVKTKVTRPYSPMSESSWAVGGSQQMPASVAPTSTFGTSPTTSSS
uniref:Intermembrane lipid transfer protein VPS13-like C-terminal domain-containing protein n=1 Tax=Brassica campestris TaxID=3711 RepID=M4F1C9_BRACM